MTSTVDHKVNSRVNVYRTVRALGVDSLGIDDSASYTLDASSYLHSKGLALWTSILESSRGPLTVSIVRNDTSLTMRWSGPSVGCVLLVW